MQIRQIDETMEKVYEYAQKLIEFQLQKKAIDEEIKSLKDEYKEEGIAVAMVQKIIGKMKAELKKSPGELLEEDILTEKMNANDSLKDMIHSLI